MAGRLLGNSWRFPKGLTLVIATHHAPPEKRREQSPFVERMISLVNLADCVGRAVRDTVDDSGELESTAASHLEDNGASSLMDNLALSRKGVLSTLKPCVEELEAHATSMGISLAGSFNKIGV